MTIPKTVIITGASQGIGRHIAIAFAQKTPYHIVLLARNSEKLAQTSSLCLQYSDSYSSTTKSSDSYSQRKIIPIAVDLTNPLEVQSFSLPQDIPTPSILVLNAGRFLYKPLATTTHQEFQEQLETNLFSAVHVVSRFLPIMKEKGEGLVIGIDSVSALKGHPDSGAYSASKHALLGYLRSLRQELLPTGIGVTAIHLGQTFSPSWDGSQIDPERLIDPEDVANLTVTLSQLSPRSVVEELTLMPKRGEVPPM